MNHIIKPGASVKCTCNINCILGDNSFIVTDFANIDNMLIIKSSLLLEYSVFADKYIVSTNGTFVNFPVHKKHLKVLN